jgi:gamma-glutamylputrescine oxidase
MSVSYWQDRSPSTQAEDYDIIVIGGGVAGVSTTYWLKQEDPSLKVALLEKGDLGYGATGRNAGFITCGSVEHFNRLVEKHGKDEAFAIWNFSETNLSLLKEHIIKDEEKSIGFEHKGSFSLASTDKEFTELKTSSDLMKTLDIHVEVIDEKGIKDRLKASGFVGGIKYCDDASVHPVKLLDLMVKRTLEKGKVDYLTNQEVHRIEQEGDLKRVETQKGSFRAPLVVLATNGYSPLLHDYFVDKIFPTRGQILVTEPVERFMEGPCYANFVLDYFRQLPTGEMIIGGFRQLQKDAEVGYSDQTTDLIQKALEEFLEKHVPKVKGKKITHRWSGIMGFSVDGQPMVGSLPVDPQLAFIGGFTAHGLGLAFHSAKVLCDSLFGREIPQFISARRF